MCAALVGSVDSAAWLIKSWPAAFLDFWDFLILRFVDLRRRYLFLESNEFWTWVWDVDAVGVVWYL